MIIRKILVSVKFLSAILGPEMAAPILWARGKIAFFLQENPPVHKIPRFRGGGELFWGFWGGGAVPIYFYGREDFSEINSRQGLSCSNFSNITELHFWSHCSGFHLFSEDFSWA